MSTIAAEIIAGMPPVYLQTRENTGVNNGIPKSEAHKVRLDAYNEEWCTDLSSWLGGKPHVPLHSYLVGMEYSEPDLKERNCEKALNY